MAGPASVAIWSISSSRALRERFGDSRRTRNAAVSEASRAALTTRSVTGSISVPDSAAEALSGSAATWCADLIEELGSDAGVAAAGGAGMSGWAGAAAESRFAGRARLHNNATGRMLEPLWNHNGWRGLCLLR